MKLINKIIFRKKTFSDLIIVDGGITQLRAAKDELIKLNINIPIVWISKKI